MAQQPKSVTIKLTTKQRTQIKSLTGQDHAEVRFEAPEAMETRSAPRRFPGRDLAKRTFGSKPGAKLSVKAGAKLSLRNSPKLAVKGGAKLIARDAGKVMIKGD